MERVTAAQLAAEAANRVVYGAVARLHDVIVTREGARITVRPIWGDVDRTEGAGIVAPNAKVADRLVRAMRAGAAFRNEQVLRDVHGKTYVNAEHRVSSRTLNADLTRLGF